MTRSTCSDKITSPSPSCSTAMKIWMTTTIRESKLWYLASSGSLTVHARIEEELFYPALRHAIGEQTVIEEADVEHAMIQASWPT